MSNFTNSKMVRVSTWSALMIACALQLLSLSIYAQTSVPTHAIDISNDPNNHILLLPHTQFLPDPTSQLTIDDILNTNLNYPFITSSADQIRFENPSGSYWFKFSLNNISQKALTLWLDCDNSRIANIELYSVSDGSYTLQRGGSHSINPQWTTQERLNNFRIDLEAQSSRDFVLRVAGSTTLRFTPRIFSEHSYTVHTAELNNQLGIILGILFALFVYTLNIYFTLKDKIFFYFLVLIVAVGIQTSASQGPCDYSSLATR